MSINTSTTPDSSSISLINFNQLVLGFSSAALLYLGEAPGLDVKDKKSLNLPLAKYNIDILSLLAEKTRGNLNPEEKELINEVMTDLKTKYAAAVRSQG